MLVTCDTLQGENAFKQLCVGMCCFPNPRRAVRGSRARDCSSNTETVRDTEREDTPTTIFKMLIRSYDSIRERILDFYPSTWGEKKQNI